MGGPRDLPLRRPGGGRGPRAGPRGDPGAHQDPGVRGMMTSRYLFRPMNEEGARKIAAWRYEAPCDFYDMTNDPEGLEKLLGPPERRRGYYAVLSGGELVGFLSYGLGGQLRGFDYPGDGCIDIG